MAAHRKTLQAEQRRVESHHTGVLPHTNGDDAFRSATLNGDVQTFDVEYPPEDVNSLEMNPAVQMDGDSKQDNFSILGRQDDPDLLVKSFFLWVPHSFSPGESGDFFIRSAQPVTCSQRVCSTSVLRRSGSGTARHPFHLSRGNRTRSRSRRTRARSLPRKTSFLESWSSCMIANRRSLAKDIVQVLDSAPVLDGNLASTGPLDCAVLHCSHWRSVPHHASAWRRSKTRTRVPHRRRWVRGPASDSHSWIVAALAQKSRRADGRNDGAQLSCRSRRCDGTDVATATKAGRRLLDSLVSKKWVTREDVSAVRDARRTLEFVELGEISGKLNAGQQKIVEALRTSGGRALTENLRGLGLSRSSLETLRKRNVVRVIEEPAEFRVSGLKMRHVLADLTFNAAQVAALEQIESGALSQQFSVSLLHGVPDRVRRRCTWRRCSR